MGIAFRSFPVSSARGSQASRATARPTPWLRTNLLRAWFTAVGVVVSFAAGIAIGRDLASRPAHVAGACIALELAETYGAIDEPRRKRIIHSLTSVANPYLDRFSVTRMQMLRTCTDFRSATLSGR